MLAGIEKAHDFPEVILPNSVEMPPLMKKFIIKDHEKKGLEVSANDNDIYPGALISFVKKIC